ncbi:hypothetical protein BJX76DRAFT_60436 [Aspergillus varians]
MSRIMQSDIIQFAIGKDQKRFWIHTALSCSFPKGMFQSSILSKTDEVVFGRCCEFLYSGDYSVPLPISNPSGGNGEQSRNNKEPSRESIGRWDPMKLKENLFHPAKFPNTYVLLTERFDQAILYESSKVLNADPEVNYAEIFLSHAEVYRFSYRTDWVSLCALSLNRLVHLLANFTLFEERTGDIVRLLKFVFEESEYMENMRDILRDYAVWNVEILMQDADFQELLNRVPSLEKAIFHSMWK